MSNKAKVHPLADVQTDKIGADTRIWQFCVIFKDAVIGENCNICSHVLIENDVVIGNNVTVKSGVQIWDGVTVKDNVHIGPNVTFTNDLIPRSKIYTPFAKTLLKKGCSVGANSTIVAGNTIGEYALIGAGSVITKNIPPFTVWYGNPAKHKGYVTKDGILLNMQLIDEKTGTLYKLIDNNLKAIL